LFVAINSQGDGCQQENPGYLAVFHEKASGVVLVLYQVFVGSVRHGCLSQSRGNLLKYMDSLPVFHKCCAT
jgi:hypothetical protein